jgi:serine/threonine protein kinase/regulation of enolase protein 1 (concanavalin A-like superfamily)
MIKNLDFCAEILYAFAGIFVVKESREMPEQGKRQGQQLGNYRLVRLLGRGGFAEVYLGQHLKLRRLAAIKVLHAYLSEKEIEAFQQEAQIIATLEHSHIVRVFDFDVQDGVPFLVMDYLPNGTLRQRHGKGGRVPLPTVVSYVRQVAEALQYAHNQRLIHRDIKPGNMLIGRNNEVVLSDFGIAVFAHSTSSMTAQASAGTIPYMAPEQIQAQARAASDQYALGVVVYEWLCGAYPFDGSFTEIMSKHLMVPPPPLRQKVPMLSAEVERVVLTALAKDPNQRFSSVQAFANALEEASQVTQKPAGALVEETVVPRPPLPQPPLSQSSSIFSTVPTPLSAQEPLPVIATSPSVQESPAEDLPKRKLSRRTAIVGLTALGGVAVGGGIAWWMLSPHPLSSVAATSLAQQTQHNAITATPQVQPTQSSATATSQAQPTQSNATATAQAQQAQHDATATAASTPPPSCGPAFSDNFQSQIHGGWTWVNPTNQATYAVTTPGTLALTAPSNVDMNATTNYEAPRLLQPVSGNFTIATQVEVSANPPTSFWAAGLLLWQDQSNFFRVELNTSTFDFEQEINGAFNHNAPNALASATISALKADLKAQRSGDTFSAYYRLPGQSWQLINTANVHLQNLQVGLILVNQTGSQFTAYYHYFSVTCN